MVKESQPKGNRWIYALYKWQREMANGTEILGNRRLCFCHSTQRRKAAQNKAANKEGKKRKVRCRVRREAEIREESTYLTLRVVVAGALRCLRRGQRKKRQRLLVLSLDWVSSAHWSAEGRRGQQAKTQRACRGTICRTISR